MIDWLIVVILGVIEGVTEFLPISSTGHLLIASALLDFRYSLNGTFEIFIQLGAVLAVIVYYRADLLRQIRAVRTDVDVRRLWLNLAVAFLPAGVVGLLLQDWIKVNLIDSPANAPLIAAALIGGGVFFLLVERRSAATDTHNPQTITLRQALAVGAAQTIALIPGVSRSGASIVGGMLGGLDRSTATRFSFYLAIPTLGIATVFDLLTSLDDLESGALGYLLLGTFVSAVVAWLSIDWLLRYVARSTFTAFGLYRIAAGIVILVLIAAKLLPG